MELLIVVAIIGLMATLTLISLGSARKKSRDASRLEDLRQIQTALELYQSDHDASYPARHVQSNGPGWSLLEADLSPYLSSLPKDPSNTGNYWYGYDGGEENDFPGYGLRCRFEYSGNYPLADQDNGFYNDGNGCCYELGPEPPYDAPANNWWSD